MTHGLFHVFKQVFCTSDKKFFVPYVFNYWLSKYVNFEEIAIFEISYHQIDKRQKFKKLKKNFVFADKI